MPQVRQSALLVVPLTFEIIQPVSVQSIPVALRLNLTPSAPSIFPFQPQEEQ